MVSATTAERAGVDVNAVAPLAPNSWLRYDVVERMLPADITEVLEVGCGQGAFGVRLAQRFRYVGVEPDRVSWAVAQRRISAGPGEVRNIGVEEIGAERFGLVCAFEVLEHIENDVAAVKEWASLLRPGGWLLLSVPAHQRRYGPGTSLSVISAVMIPGRSPRYWPAAASARSRCASTVSRSAISWRPPAT